MSSNQNVEPPKSSVYLDYNATTPLAPEVTTSIQSSLTQGWANPSSAHGLGRNAATLISNARTSIAKMIKGQSEDIIFTSGGTEANNLALNSGIQAYLSQGHPDLPHVITSSVEHDSVIRVLEDWVKKGKIELSIIPVNPKTGHIEITKVLDQIKDSTCLITIMHANNETGVIMPIPQLTSRISDLNQKRSIRILTHTDSAQTIGKIRVDVSELGVDYLTIVGHKFYGPRIGALWVRDLKIPPSKIYPLLFGGGQEGGHRPGTENTPMIVGLGAAADLVDQNLKVYQNHMELVRDYFGSKLIAQTPGVTINFYDLDPIHRLPNTLSVRFPPESSASSLLQACGDSVHASLGAACHSDVHEPSRILLASGLTSDEASRTIRFSIGRETSLEDIEDVIRVLMDALVSLDLN